MTRLTEIIWFLLTALIAYIVSVSPLTSYTPQLIALISILLTLTHRRFPNLIIYLLSFMGHLIVFVSGGLTSPLFFLIYFLLFTIAFRHRPSVTLALALGDLVLLSQTLISPTSLLPLASLLLIGPLAWFIGQQYLENLHLENTIATDETDILYWLNLKFKTGILKILDTTSDLLSSPTLTHSQKEKVKYIKDSSRSLLNSAAKLSAEIDATSDHDPID